MRTRKTRLMIIGAAVMLALMGMSCDDNPIKPQPPKDYYVYFSDYMAPNTYYRYNTGTKAVDSFYLPYNSVTDGFGISPDGKTMYLHPDEGIVEVELDSFTVVAEHPLALKKSMRSEHQVLVSPDGRYLALLHEYLYIVDLADYSVIYSDTVNHSGNGWFTADSRNLICYINDTTDNYSHVYVLEVSLGDTLSAVRYEFPFGAPTRIIASGDDRKWYMLMYIINGHYGFQVYDRDLDSVIYHHSMCFEGGDLQITPNGNEVIYSYYHPGYIQVGCAPKDIITVFDAIENRLDRDVRTLDDSLGMVISVGGMAITPDGRYLIGVSTDKAQIFHYDLKKKKIVNRMQFGGYTWLFNAVCQRKP
jgi:hypothetical protein